MIDASTDAPSLLRHFSRYWPNPCRVGDDTEYSETARRYLGDTPLVVRDLNQRGHTSLD